jgi:hypothetical protein
MAGEKSRTEMFGAAFKDLMTALRDSVLFLLFVLLIFAPSTIRERLVEAGFTKGSIAGFEWEAQIKSAAETTKSAGATVVQAAADYDKLMERLAELEKRVTDPSVRSEIRDLGSVAASSRTDLASADQAIKRSLVAQQQIVTQIAPQSVADAGWIYLGKVNEEKTQWAEGAPKTVRAASPAVAKGDRLTVIDDVYLRGDTASSARSSAPVLAVAKVGETVEVVDLDYSHAKGGGWFVWAKVRRS